LAVAVAILWLASFAAAAGAEPAPSENSAYHQALSPREWSFPRDHGRHDGFKTEWWYFTGHLRDGSGRRFGCQFTIFRSALTATPVPRESGWAVTDLYLLHVAVSDFGAGKFRAADRAQRGRPALAFAADDTLDVYLLDASAKLDRDTIRVRASERDFAFDLTCTPTRRTTTRGHVSRPPGG
jgi:predicted secreted hydrolase